MAKVEAGRMKDPVCGMEIEKDKAATTYKYKGQTYYFCAPGCKRRFAKDPEKYIGGGHALSA